jgi:hypothetical protein
MDLILSQISHFDSRRFNLSAVRAGELESWRAGEFLDARDAVLFYFISHLSIGDKNPSTTATLR